MPSGTSFIPSNDGGKQLIQGNLGLWLMLSSPICTVCECSEVSCESCQNRDECANCASCCCSQAHTTWRRVRIHQGVTVEYFSLGWMAIEVIGSIGVGLLSGSFALLAFGGDSLVEILSGFATTLHLRGDSAGSNELGEKTEKATTLLLVALIPVIGGGALYSYFTGIRPESSLLGIAVALGAVIVMPVLWVKKRGIGRETNCAPLLMDAIQSATCFLMSLALLGGLLINYLFGISWVDYAATAVILAFVGKESIEAIRKPTSLPISIHQHGEGLTSV